MIAPEQIKARVAAYRKRTKYADPIYATCDGCIFLDKELAAKNAIKLPDRRIETFVKSSKKKTD